MKRFFARMFNSLPKRILAGAIASVMLAVPVANVVADNSVSIAVTTGVANVTAGDTTYSSAINATYDQVIKVEVVYTNTEAADSNLVANNLNIKINVPTTPGTNQVISTTTGGSNTNQVNGQANVTLSDPTSYLQYEPGSAVAVLTAPDGTISTVNIPDDVVLGSGYNVANGNPCQSASVSILARVMVPGVKIVKQSEVLGQSNQWSNNNTAAAGDTLKYLITYQNIGNTVENNVIISDNLPPSMTLVPNTTSIINSSYPSGTPDSSNNIATGGVNIGNYNPGAGGYVEFEVTVPQASALSCGLNEFRNVGVAQPQGMNQYYNTAVTDVTVNCPAPTPKATFACNALNITQSGNAITASVNTSATNGASLSSVTYNFGDGSTPLTTTNSNVNYTYAAVTATTTYTVTATATFAINGSTTGNTSACTKQVTISAPAPVVTASTTPTTLVNTGPGEEVFGIFAIATIGGALLHRLFKNRQAAHNNQ